jgi:hypothetical protein
VPNNPNSFPVLHASELKRHIPNNGNLFPSWEFARPNPVLTKDGEEEWVIESIIDERWRGRGMQYLVKWVGYRDEENRWLPVTEMKKTDGYRDENSKIAKPWTGGKEIR